MENYIQKIESTLREHSNSENALHMRKYMKNQFEYFGIKAPLRKEITREFLRKDNLPSTTSIHSIIHSLWEKPEREFQYFAMELLTKYVKSMESNFIQHLEYLITTKSWWDTVDFIAANLVGNFFLIHPELISPTTDKWAKSDNMWLQRTSILFQLKYKSSTDLKLLFRYIKMHSDSKDFFIRKAIGWALRVYSKTDPKTVSEFVKSNKLSGLSTREALKRIK